MNDLQIQFWSRAARNYDRVVDLQIGPATRSMIRERIEKEAALGNVAELGCGTGFHTLALASKADSVVATDLSQSASKKAAVVCAGVPGRRCGDVCRVCDRVAG